MMQFIYSIARIERSDSNPSNYIIYLHKRKEAKGKKRKKKKNFFIFFPSTSKSRAAYAQKDTFKASGYIQKLLCYKITVPL